jgi:hypothetical protein
MTEYSEQDVMQMIENVDEHDDINYKAPEKPEKEELQQKAEDAGFKFNSIDDLLAHELSYNAAGKEVVEDIATIKQRASQGYHYAQEMARLKQERQAFETENLPQIEKAKELESKYGKFESYAKENPEWYDHWANAWEQRGQQNTSELSDSQNIENVLKTMLSEHLKPVNDFMQQQQGYQQQQQVTSEDKALADDVQKTRDQFKQVDFDKSDPESGASLEFQVLKYMNDTGINNFNAAFKAYYHDNLVQLQMQQAQEAKQQAEVEDRKNGILETKYKPNGAGSASHKNRNYDQMMEIALTDKSIFK